MSADTCPPQADFYIDLASIDLRDPKAEAESAERVQTLVEYQRTAASAGPASKALPGCTVGVGADLGAEAVALAVAANQIVPEVRHTASSSAAVHVALESGNTVAGSSQAAGPGTPPKADDGSHGTLPGQEEVCGGARRDSHRGASPSAVQVQKSPAAAAATAGVGRTVERNSSVLRDWAPKREQMAIERPMGARSTRPAAVAST